MDKQQLASMVAKELAQAKIDTINAKKQKGIVEFTLKELGYQLATLVFMVGALSYIGLDNLSLINENKQLKLNQQATHPITTQNHLISATFSPFKIIPQDFERIECDDGLITSLGNVNFCKPI